MLAGRTQYLQILWSIIVSDAIDVMDYFVRLQQATKRLFRDQSMFKDGVILVLMWMVGHVEANIAGDSALSPALPCVGEWMACLRHHFLRGDVTRPRTKAASCDLRGWNGERFLADRADNLNGHKTLRESVDWQGPAGAETLAVSA